MTSQRRIVVPVLAGVAAVVLVVLGIKLHWAVWFLAVLVLACCAVGVLAYFAGRPAPPEVLGPPLPVVEPPTPPQLVAVQGVNLASSWDDYEFLFGATIYWRPVGGPTATRHLRPAARAVDAIIERAATVAASERPDLAVRLQHRLNDILGVLEQDPSGRIEAWADQVQITLPDADVQRLCRMAEIRKDKVLWEHERRFECDRRQYLSEDVLRSTGSALVWWLTRNESDVTGAAELIDTLARLSAAARDEQAIPALGSDGAGQPLGLDFTRFTSARSPVELVTALMDALNLPDDQRLRFADQAARNIANTGNTRAADEIREHFGLLTEDEVAADSGDGTWQEARAWPEDDRPDD